MAQNKRQTFGPVYVASAAGNLVAPAAAGASAVGYTATATYILINQIHLANTDTGTTRTVVLYLGATGGSAGGTEIAPTISIPPNSAVDLFFANGLRLEGTNGFLTGTASAASKIVLTATGEVGLV